MMSHSSTCRPLAACLISLAVLGASRASAEEEVKDPSTGPRGAVLEETRTAEPSLARRFGFGSALGGGVTATIFGGQTLVLPGVLVPTLEARLFLESGSSIDLSLPVVNVVSASISVRGLALTLDGFYNFNLGSEGVRFLIGPGLGLAVIAAPYVASFGVKVPVQVGVEFLTKSRVFGFSLQARPYVEATYVAIGTGSITRFGAGALAVLGFNWYATTH
jgi:hypothetical protein